MLPGIAAWLSSVRRGKTRGPETVGLRRSVGFGHLGMWIWSVRSCGSVDSVKMGVGMPRRGSVMCPVEEKKMRRKYKWMGTPNSFHKLQVFCRMRRSLTSIECSLTLIECLLTIIERSLTSIERSSTLIERAWCVNRGARGKREMRTIPRSAR